MGRNMETVKEFVDSLETSRAYTIKELADKYIVENGLKYRIKLEAEKLIKKGKMTARYMDGHGKTYYLRHNLGDVK